MATAGGPNIETDGLVLKLDAANIKSFRGDPTTNTVVFPSAGANRYNNPGFSGTITDTGETFMGSPIWEVTFIPQDSGRVPRLGSTEGFGFFHSMGTLLLANTQYMASVYVRSEYPLLNTPTQGFANTYSNIPGWGFGGTSTTQTKEGEWTRLHTRYFNNIVIGGISYSNRSVNNTLNAIVNTTQTTQVLVTITIQSNGTFSTTTEYGTSTAGGTITQFTQHEGLRSANPNITNNGGIVGLSTGTSAIINHGLNSSTFTRITDSNPVFKVNYPFQYFILMNIPSTDSINRTISFRLNMNGFYTALSDAKFWKIRFDVSNLQVNDVIRTYWAAPMIEQHSRDLPSRFITDTRGTTVATGGGWADRSGNSNHGELINGPTFDSGNGGSIVFDGVDDSITTASNISFSITEPWSYSIWLSPAAGMVGAWKNIIGQNADTNCTWMFHPVGLGFYQSFFNSQTYIWYTSIKPGTTLPIDKFSNITITCSPVDTDRTLLRSYLNGIARDVTTFTWAPVNRTQVFNRIGGNGSRYYVGNIANTQIYNKVLTPQEILQNYNATKGRFGL